MPTVNYCFEYKFGSNLSFDEVGNWRYLTKLFAFDKKYEHTCKFVLKLSEWLWLDSTTRVYVELFS